MDPSIVFAAAPSLVVIANYISGKPITLHQAPHPDPGPRYPGCADEERVVLEYRRTVPAGPWTGTHEVSLPSVALDEYRRRMDDLGKNPISATIRLLREVDAIVLVREWDNEGWPCKACVFDMGRSSVRIGFWEIAGRYCERVADRPAVDCYVPDLTYARSGDWVQLSGVLGGIDPNTSLPVYKGPAVIRGPNGPTSVFRIWDDLALVVHVTPDGGVRVVTGTTIQDSGSPCGIQLGSQFVEYSATERRATVSVHHPLLPPLLVKLEFEPDCPALARVYGVTDTSAVVCAAVGPIGEPNQLAKVLETFSTISAMLMARADKATGADSLRNTCSGTNAIVQDVVSKWLLDLADAHLMLRAPPPPPLPPPEVMPAEAAVRQVLNEVIDVSVGRMSKWMSEWPEAKGPLTGESLFEGRMPLDSPDLPPIQWVGTVRYTRYRASGIKFGARVTVTEVAGLRAEVRPRRGTAVTVPLDCLVRDQPSIPDSTPEDTVVWVGVWVGPAPTACRAVVVGGCAGLTYLKSELSDKPFGCDLATTRVPPPGPEPTGILFRPGSVPSWDSIAAVYPEGTDRLGCPTLPLGTETFSLVDLARMAHPYGATTSPSTLGCRLTVNLLNSCRCSENLECRRKPYLVSSNQPHWRSPPGLRIDFTRMADRMMSLGPPSPKYPLGSVVMHGHDRTPPTPMYGVVCGGGTDLIGMDVLHVVRVSMSQEPRVAGEVMYLCINADRATLLSDVDAAKLITNERAHHRGPHGSREPTVEEQELQEELIREEEKQRQQTRRGKRAAKQQRKLERNQRLSGPWVRVAACLSIQLASEPIRSAIVAAADTVRDDMFELRRLVGLYAHPLVCPLGGAPLGEAAIVGPNGHLYNRDNLETCLKEWPDAILPTHLAQPLHLHLAHRLAPFQV